MAKRLWISFALFFLCAGAASAQDAKTVLQDAQKAMGNVTSIQYSGTGHLNFFGQAWTPDSADDANRAADTLARRLVPKATGEPRATFSSVCPRCEVNGGSAYRPPASGRACPPLRPAHSVRAASST